MLDMLVEAEVQRRVRVGRGDDVPAGASTADMVQRGEAASNMIGRVERRRCGGDQPDMVSDGGERRQKRERLERGDRVAAPQRLDRHVENGQMVGHEEGVELRRLQGLGEALQMREIEIGVGIGTRIAPGAGVQADGAHEGAEAQLFSCHERCSGRSIQSSTVLESFSGSDGQPSSGRYSVPLRRAFAAFQFCA